MTLYLDGTNWWADSPGSTVGGVTQLLAGTNITISPSGGTGVVTVNAASSSAAWTQNDVTLSRAFGVVYTASISNLLVEVCATVPSSGQVGVQWNIQGYCGPTSGTMILVTQNGVSNAAAGAPGITFAASYGYSYEVILNATGISPAPTLTKWVEVSM